MTERGASILIKGYNFHLSLKIKGQCTICKRQPKAQASYLKDLQGNWIWPLSADRCKKQFEVYRPLEVQEKWNTLKNGLKM